MLTAELKALSFIIKQKHIKRNLTLNQNKLYCDVCVTYACRAWHSAIGLNGRQSDFHWTIKIPHTGLKVTHTVTDVSGIPNSTQGHQSLRQFN